MHQRFTDFITGITVCYKYIQRIKATEMTELGLKGSHGIYLFFLHHNPEGLTASQLCRLCSEDKAATSRGLAALQKMGYIQTDEKKYRSNILLTDAGHTVAQKIDHVVEQWVTFGGAKLTDEEREDFYQSLKIIAQSLQAHYDKLS